MEPGTRLGAYEVLAAIGRGTSGAVVRARAPDGRVVAVKVLERASEAALGRFERERRVLSEIGEAEGFVQLLDAGASPHGPYIVMTCVEGGTLAARIAAGPLGGEAVRVLGLALARALAAAHARGIVHRDMKPSNVLLRADGRPLIADLGLAKHFERAAPGAAASRDLTQTGSIHGSMGYMAPEQLGDSKSVGPAADVFALGTILYECLVGSLPFTAPSLVGLLVKIEGGQREPIRSSRPDVDRRLARTIERCLAPTPTERFADGAALARELEQAKPPARARALAGALLAAVVLAGAAIAFVKARPASPSGTATPPRPPAPVAPAPPPPQQLPAPTSNADALALARSALARSKQDPEAAIDQASRAVALDPRCALARLARAQARLDLEFRLAGGRAPAMKARAAEAAAIRADIEAALGLDAKCAAAYSLRAGLAALEGDRSAAHEDSQRALALDPRDGRANLLSASWFFQKDPARALTHIDATIAAGHEPGRAWSLRAMLHAQKNRDDLALQDLGHAVEGDPLDASVIAMRAELYLRRADYEAALRDAERAVSLDPLSAIGWHVRGAARGERGEPRRALEDLGRALELDPLAAATYCVRGTNHMKLGDSSRALADFGQAIAIRKDFALAYDQRAGTLEKLGDARGAIEDSRACLKLSPNGPLAGRCRERLARLDKK